jgi:hypothetical protein
VSRPQRAFLVLFITGLEVAHEAHNLGWMMLSMAVAWVFAFLFVGSSE